MDRRDFLRKDGGRRIGGIQESCAALAVGSDAQALQPLRKRRLGKTGMDLSIIGFFASANGRPELAAAKPMSRRAADATCSSYEESQEGGIDAKIGKRAFEVGGSVRIVVRAAARTRGHATLVAEAVDHGVNYFDVAPSYGHAEERFGSALEPYRQRDLYLTMHQHGSSATSDGAAGGTGNFAQKTLRRQTHLDLYAGVACAKQAENRADLGKGRRLSGDSQAARSAASVSHRIRPNGAGSVLDRFDL